ncbi:MAG TPA: hypothetical protein VH054_20305 [Polyangiaceae bacterium]|jgi:hypothetical protein|nr:hypothetical protein [Polyangiaceae bacterium]
MRFTWILVAVTACGPTNTGFNDDGGNDAAVDSPFNGDSGGFGDSSTQDSGGGGKTLLYAHDNTTLYQLDPQSLGAPVTIGDFDCIGGTNQPTSMTDIAVDKSGNVYAVSQVAAYPLTINGNNVHCAATWTLPAANVFYGLTFAPENTVNAAETLVAADSGGIIWSIDSQGNTAKLGTFGKDANNQTYELSGDIVFLANNGTPVGFATVRACPNNTCATADTLVEIDMTKLKANNTSSVVKSVRGVLHQGSKCQNTTAPPSYGKMYGIAAFEDQVYGFSHDTGIVAINNVDASVCLVTVPNGIAWSGAGVTTVAPVIAPPN